MTVKELQTFITELLVSDPKAAELPIRLMVCDANRNVYHVNLTEAQGEHAGFVWLGSNLPLSR